MKYPSFVSTHRYIDPAHLALEKDAIFNRAWLRAGLSSQLGLPNSCMTLELQGVSILLIRGDDGITRAFRNACTHRGTRIAHGKKSNCATLKCPYHGWEYDSRGRLVSVPKANGIAASKKRNLHQLKCHEMAGMIWVCLEEPKTDIFSELGRLQAQLQPYRLDEMEPLSDREFKFKVNWKIALENALDYYHVPRVHSKTVNAHVDSSPTFTDMGNHNLQTLHIAPYSWRRRLDAHCARGGPYSVKQMESLHKYFVFPNLVLNVLPYHLTVMQLFPIDATSCTMKYQFCLRNRPGLIERLRGMGTYLASRWILYEDVRLYSEIQHGMHNAGTLQPLHEDERAIAHFHGRLSNWIDSNDSSKQAKAQKEA